jgi:hypothetical protein
VIASVWHWPPSEMRHMTLVELMDWEARAEQLIPKR